jgi:hypothetical protein
VGFIGCEFWVGEEGERSFEKLMRIGGDGANDDFCTHASLSRRSLHFVIVIVDLDAWSQGHVRDPHRLDSVRCYTTW